MKIEGAVALVTGANGGIGRALVRALVERKVRHVYATTRSAAVDHPDGHLVTSLRMDVTDTCAVSDVANLASDVTLLINNAGVLTKGEVLQASSDDIWNDLETNCLGLVTVVRRFADVLEGNGGGTILNVLSISALANSPSIGVYSASKAAAWSMTQAMRASLARRNIRVLGAFPGPVDTAMTRGMEARKADPKDVARAMLDGVEGDVEEIFPDAMSRQAGAIWGANPKLLERQFSSL